MSSFIEPFNQMSLVCSRAICIKASGVNLRPLSVNLFKAKVKQKFMHLKYCFIVQVRFNTALKIISHLYFSDCLIFGIKCTSTPSSIASKISVMHLVIGKTIICSATLVVQVTIVWWLAISLPITSPTGFCILALSISLEYKSVKSLNVVNVAKVLLYQGWEKIKCLT